MFARSLRPTKTLPLKQLQKSVHSVPLHPPSRQLSTLPPFFMALSPRWPGLSFFDSYPPPTKEFSRTSHSNSQPPETFTQNFNPTSTPKKSKPLNPRAEPFVPSHPPEQVKSQTQMDEELRTRLEEMSGGGGAAGLEYEDGRPVAMKRSVKNNMFRVI